MTKITLVELYHEIKMIQMKKMLPDNFQRFGLTRKLCHLVISCDLLDGDNI